MYDQRSARNVMVGAGTAKDVSSTGVFAYTWNFSEPGSVKQLACKVTTVMSSSAAIVVTFRRRPVYGSASSGATAQTTLGTITIAKTAAANVLYVNNITPVNISAGDQIVADCTTAATVSGACIAYVSVDFNPETSLNETVTVVTA